MFTKKNKFDISRRGFTLIEVLVVVGLLIVLAAIMIPTVKLINNDRRIRESARMVNMFATSVRDASVVDGESAFMLVRNRNNPDRCYDLWRMRVLPGFSGTAFNSTVSVQTYNDGTNTYYYFDVEVPLGGNKTAVDNEYNIKVGDSIKFNNSLGSYRIGDIEDSLLLGFGGSGMMATVRCTLDFCVNSSGQTISLTDRMVMPPVATPLIDPVPPSTPVPFTIYRRPVVSASGRMELPGNQYIDMSRSGPLHVSATVPGLGDTYFSEPNYALGALPYEDGYGAVVVVFDSNGALDRFYIRYGTIDEAVFPFVKSLWLYIASDEEDKDPMYESLDNPDGMWISINRSNGSVYTGQVTQTSPVNGMTYTIHDKILDSRFVARRRLRNTE